MTAGLVIFLLIEPYGIETEEIDWAERSWELLIEPYGIETLVKP